MGQIGDGLTSDAIEQNPDVALLQARVQGAAQQARQVSLPATGFVAQLNGQEGAINIQPGTSSPGVTVAVTNGVGTISIGVTGFGALATVQCNLTAIVDPTGGDDSSAGYAAGSVWLNIGTPSVWMCITPTLGLAQWLQLG